MAGVVVADEAPQVVLDQVNLGDRGVEGAYLERAGAGPFRASRSAASTSSVAGNDDGLIRIGIGGAPDRLADRNWNAAMVSPPGKLVPNGSSHQPTPYRPT